MEGKFKHNSKSKADLIHEMQSKLSRVSDNQLMIELMNAHKLLHLSSPTSELLNFLTQMEQILSQMPSKLILNTLNKLAAHPDLDVKLSVSCCMIKILSIRATNGSCNYRLLKNQLKTLFELVVIGFEKLSYSSGECYTKLTMHLKTFNNVRLPVLLSELMLDQLYVQLFKQLLTVSEILKSNCSEFILEMEKCMTMIIEENEELTQELVNLIVTSVKKDNQVSLLFCRQVIKNCDALLKKRLPDKVVKQVYDSLEETIPSTTVTNKFKIHKRKSECLEGSRLQIQSATNNNIQSKKQGQKLGKSGKICVQGYKVNQSSAPILESIFKKHGDIASNCIFRTPSLKTQFLEIVCEVVNKIQNYDVKTIISDMEEIECQVSDAESANINVVWLRAHLESVCKSKEATENLNLLTEMKTNTVLVKRAAQMDLRERSEELVVAQQRFEKAEKCVRVLHLVEKKLNDNILESENEKDSWVKEPIL